MRAIFLFLVFANLAFFAWANFFSEADSQSDPRPKAREVAPEKMKVMPVGSAEKPAAKLTPAAEPISALPASAKACLELGGFTTDDAAKAGEALAPLALGTRLSQRHTDDPAAKWWVFIAPQTSRQEAQKKAAELKALGVDEYFIVQDEGLLRHSLSLGVFKTEDAASSRLEALRSKGVRSAQLGPRDTSLRKVYFQVKPVDDALAAKLREIARAFGGSELRGCPPVNASYLPSPLMASTTILVPVARSRMLSSTRT